MGEGKGEGVLCFEVVLTPSLSRFAGKGGQSGRKKVSE